MQRAGQILATLILLAALTGGCASFPIAKLPGGAEFVLSGPLEKAFTAITAHDAKGITLGESLTIYGGKPDSANMICHEAQHRNQARRIADMLVVVNAIDDNPRARAVVWLAVYGQEYLQHGYNNRFEKEAREACKEIPEGQPEITGISPGAPRGVVP